MQVSLIPFLACPDCGADVELVQNDDPEGTRVLNGVLQCLGCRRTFPVKQRIPMLLPRSMAAAQKQEMEARDDQVGEYDSNLPLTMFGLVEIPLTLNRLELRPKHRLLEAGCGTGRMTTKLAQNAAEVVAIDFSMASLRENAIKLQTAQLSNVHLIQGDLCHLPLKSGQFDRAVSCQVLEHVPTPELRDIAVANIAHAVKPGANVVISAYQLSRWTKDKEGEHEGGIPYFRFTREEFSELLGEHFSIESIDSSLVYIHMARCARATVQE